MRQWLQEMFTIMPAHAGKVSEGLETAAETADLSTQENLPRLIGDVLEYVLGFVGVILLIVIIYGGVTWMTAGGDEDRVKKARNLIVNGIIGIIIIALSYTILNYVMNWLLAPLQ